MKFKVGDKVRCIMGYHEMVIEGEIYTVSKISKEGWLNTKETGNTPWAVFRFEIVQPEPQVDDIGKAAAVALLELYAALGDWRRNALEALEDLNRSNDFTDISKIVDYTTFTTAIGVCERARALVEKEVKDIVEEAIAREGL